MSILEKAVGLKAAILLSKVDGVVRIRVPHDELTKWGEDGRNALIALGAEVEILYHDEQDEPLASAHVTVLKGRGVAASVCYI
ncbi:MAG: hypothetical protein KAX55_00265 [Propionivibrio sp.]|nr:hypothetical protein [Propionivibrio sp.]